MFTLGRGEVIKGWDQGVAGMAVGGERKLTIRTFPSSRLVIRHLLIPPTLTAAALAYGKKGTQGIPGNATLHFGAPLFFRCAYLCCR